VRRLDNKHHSNTLHYPTAARCDPASIDAIHLIKINSRLTQSSFTCLSTPPQTLVDSLMTILITGANRGIGLALAEYEAARGSNVIGTARGALPASKDQLTWEHLEVTDHASHMALASRLAGKPIDLLVCNAGIYPDRGQKLESGYPAEMWTNAFAVNVTGVFMTIQTLLPNIRAAHGKIAIISSQMASDTKAPGGAYIYRASKAAVLNLGRNLATDLRNEGIPVGIYHPGWVRTEMGGSSADIGVDDSAHGLALRFDALSIETTGCFECWDGRAHPY